MLRLRPGRSDAGLLSEDTAARADWIRRGTVVSMVLGAAYVYAFRRIGVVTSPYLWAEDAGVFLKDAAADGIDSLISGYAGQYFFVQRLTAFLAQAFPISWQPALYVLVGVATAILSCSWLLSSRWRFDVPLSRRFLVMLAILCAPTVDEVHANLTNVHWWLAIGLVLIGLLRDPVTVRGRVYEVVFTVAAALTGFAALYGLPMLVVRAIQWRSRQSLLLAGIAVAGLGLQGVFLLTSHARDGSVEVLLADPQTLLVVAVKRVFGAMALGDQYLNVLWPATEPTWWVYGLLVVTITCLAVLLARLPRLVALGLLAVCALGVALGMWATTMAPITPAALIAPGAASRYFLVPLAALYLVFAVVERWSAPAAAAAGILCLVSFVPIASEYRVPADQMFDQTAFYACMDRGVGDCTTTVPPGWTITVRP